MTMSGADRNEDRTREFVRLLSKHEQDLTGYIVSLVPNWSDADEIAQETKIKLWEQFEQYDPAKDFGGWARAIAYYQVLTYRKRQQRRIPSFSLEFIDLVSEEAARVSDQTGARRAALSDCLERLSHASRQFIWHYYSGEQTVKEIALELGRSVRGAQLAAARIRGQLQVCIENKLRGENDR